MDNPTEQGVKKSSSEFVEGFPDYAVNVLEGLVKRIAEGNAIVYVGAGVSQSAGLPSWNNLLKKLEEEAAGRLKNQSNVATDYFRSLKDKARSLEVGDWLLRLLGPEFQHVISISLSEGEDLCHIEPSEIHLNLVRLPFSMAITTNYDLLLETAYEKAYRVCSQKLPYLTWKHTEEILRASNRRPFRIVHAHGTVGDSNSIVLSRSQYTMLHDAQPRFGEVLKGLLKNKTFLFVGAGLEDPDLIFQLQEAIAENAGAVGPHYALLPYDEAPQIRRDILRKSLHIEVVPVGSSDLEKSKTDWRTHATSAILQALSGRVALRRFDSALPGFPTSDDPMFCLNIALRNLLKHAIEFTGSSRGDFCLSREGAEGHVSGELFYEIAEGINGPELAGHRVAADSVCGVAYYQATTEYGVYVGNVNAVNLAEEINNRSHLHYYGEIRYVRGDNSVQSELALPIEADGVRVGVLNLESNLKAAYGENHLQNDDYLRVARRFAEKAGRLYAAAHERDRRGARLKAELIEADYDEMKKLCVRLWGVARGREGGADDKSQPLEFLIYRANYRKGDLISQNPTRLLSKYTSGVDRTVPAQCFPFHSAKTKNCYLCTRIFLEGRPYYYPNVRRAIDVRKITNMYSRQLGLSRCLDGKIPASEKAEPIIGFPILIHGLVAGVFVAWHYRSGLLTTADFEQDELDGRDIELLRRASHFMANYFKRGSEEAVREDHGASIRKVNQILDCISRSGVERLSENDSDLNVVGWHYRNAIGSAVRDFLIMLRDDELLFREFMRNRGEKEPTDWVSPNRCRCWIRIKPFSWEQGDASERPIFLLAFQLELSTDDGDATTENWKNMYTINAAIDKGLKGIATRPLPSARMAPSQRIAWQQMEHGAKSWLEKPGTGQTDLQTIEVDCYDGEKWIQENIEVAIFNDDRHLSFLLSRVSTYPYSFQQQPRTIGVDMMAEILQKDTNAPWFVAPLIVGNQTQWQEEGEPEDAGGMNSVNPDAERQLVGYLTFDRTIRAGSNSSSDRIEVRDDWARFRNDVLHQMALFGACLAHVRCFEKLADGTT